MDWWGGRLYVTKQSPADQYYGLAVTEDLEILTTDSQWVSCQKVRLNNYVSWAIKGGPLEWLCLGLTIMWVGGLQAVAPMTLETAFNEYCIMVYSALKMNVLGIWQISFVSDHHTNAHMRQVWTENIYQTVFNLWFLLLTEKRLFKPTWLCVKIKSFFYV